MSVKSEPDNHALPHQNSEQDFCFDTEPSENATTFAPRPLPLSKKVLGPFDNNRLSTDSLDNIRSTNQTSDNSPVSSYFLYLSLCPASPILIFLALHLSGKVISTPHGICKSATFSVVHRPTRTKSPRSGLCRSPHGCCLTHAIISFPCILAQWCS